jgi:cytochrome c-type biogenesis protein CcmH/NrfG
MLNQDPFAVAIWVQLGNALKEAGKVAEAELAYCRAVALGAEGLDTLLSLCGLLKRQQKTAEAANSAT